MGNRASGDKTYVAPFDLILFFQQFECMICGFGSHNIKIIIHSALSSLVKKHQLKTGLIHVYPPPDNPVDVSAIVTCTTSALKKNMHTKSMF